MTCAGGGSEVDAKRIQRCNNQIGYLIVSLHYSDLFNTKESSLGISIYMSNIKFYSSSLYEQETRSQERREGPAEGVR